MALVGYIFFVLFVALFNMSLGYALAVYLGHAGLNGPWAILSLYLRPTAVDTVMPAPDSEQRFPETAAESAAAAATSETPLSPPTSVTPLAPKPLVAPVITFDNDLSLDDALSQFQQEMNEVHGDLVRIDGRVRDCAASPTVEGVEACVDDLKEAGRRCLDQQTSAFAVLDEQLHGSDDAELLGQQLRHAAGEQAQQLRSTLESLDDWQPNAEHLTDDCRRLLAQTGHMLSSCEEISSTLQQAEAVLQTMQQERTAAATRPQTPSGSPLAVVEKEISAWRLGHADAVLTVAIVEVDHTEKLLEHLEPTLCADAFHRVTNIVFDAEDVENQPLPLGNGAYFLLFGELANAECISRVERVRRTIAALAPPQDGVHITASCALATVKGDETCDSVFQRLNDALQQARDFGGNRTFLSDSSASAPVMAAGREKVTQKLQPETALV